MAQIVKLRRSSVSGQKPTNSNLQLGELALNTTDGKVYMAKSGSLGPSVEELITTNTINTGSIHLTGNVTASNFTGSFKGDGSQLYNIPSSGVTGLELNKIVSGSATASISPDKGLEINTNTTITGSLTVSGSGNFIGTQIVTGSLFTSGSNELVGNTILSGTLKIEGQYPASAGSQSVSIKGNMDMDGYLRLDPVSSTIDTSISGAYLFVTSSTGDLYFAQNIKGFNNATRLRWLEGNMYTGLLSGGVITATNGGTTFNVSKGSGIIVELNASLTDDPYPTTNYVEWDSFTGQTLDYRTTHIQTFIGIDNSGAIHQQTEAFNDGQYNNIITLGTVIHQNLSTVNASITYPNVAYGYKQRTYDFIKAFGALKLSGLNIIPSGSLGLNVGSGTAWADGRNYQNDPDNPSYIIDSGTAVSKIFRYYQVSGTTFVQDTNNGAGYTDIDPTQYVLNGVLMPVVGNYTIQRVFWYPNSATKGIVVYYGNGSYGTIREAIDNINVETFVEIENTKQNAVYLGAIIIAGNTDFTNPNKHTIIPGGLFRSVGGSGGGGAIPTSRLTDLTDVDVSNANNGDLISYNDVSLKWEHTKQLSGSYQITGSLITIGSISASSLTGSINFNNLTNIPTLVSGSSQIIISGTTGYSTFSSSISTSIGELSSSVATTTNDLDGRLDSIEGVTGSYATTGSNLFKGTQTISGSVIIGTGSLDLISPEVLHVENSGSYNIARFDGYDYNYVQVNLQNHHSGSAASTDFVLTADNGTETIHYVDLGINSSTYNAGYVGYENDAYLLNAGNDLYVGTVGGAGHPSNLNLFAQNSWENPQVVISGSKQISFNTGSVSNGYQYEFSGSIKADHNLNVVGSVTSSFGVDSPTITNNGHTWEFLSAGQMRPAGTIMGSSYDSNQVDVQNLGPLLLKGMAYGAQVITSPDNGSTSYTWEFGTDGKLSIPGDVNINGTVTAKELHINLITSSVLYESGSTKFGDTSDDTHNFTGSVYISGGINVGSITGSIDFNNLTNTPTLVSGSPQISYTGITNVPSGIVSGSSQISFNGITDVPTLVSGSSQISYTGIIDTPSGIVSGSSQISYTGITDTPSGIVSSSQQVIDLGFVTTGSFESFTGSYVSDSGSFDTRIDNIFGSLTGLTETYNFHTSSFTSFSSSIESHTSSINNFTSSVVLSSQTSSMTVLSSSYALTASYALNGGGGGTEGRTAKLNQTVASSTWTFNHNLGEKHPAIEIFNEDDYVVVPTNILAVSDNTLTITFSSPVSGTATATVGGGIPFISASYDGRVLAVNDGGPTWKEGIISGSLQIEEFGYSTTGSNSFVGEQIVTGSLTIRNAKIDATCVTVSTGTTIFDLSSFDGATFDYVVKNGGNMRAGTIVSVWSGAVSSYNETSTIDLGNTSAITFEVSGDGKLNTVISSGTWIVEVLYRALGCTS